MNYQALINFDREVERIENDLENGDIDVSEYNEKMRDIRNEHNDAAEEAAREEYESWYR